MNNDNADELRADTAMKFGALISHRRQKWLVSLTFIIIATSGSALFMLTHERDKADWMWDMMVFRHAGQAVLNGSTIYWQSPGTLYTHTPFNALIYVLISILPLPLVALLWNALTLASLQIALWFTLPTLGAEKWQSRLAISCVTTVASILIDPRICCWGRSIRS